jgi:hypothetical protein
MSKYISKTSVTICAALFAVGVAQGWMMYTQRSSDIEKHIAGTNSIALHIILALVLFGAVAVTIFYRKFAPNKPYIIWLAPFTKTAFERTRNAIFLRNGRSKWQVAKAILVALLLLFFLFNFFRAGMQVLVARDPNATVNAWGGPGYWGASLAHWMDAIYLIYVEAGLIALLTMGPEKRPKKQRGRKS